MLNPALQAGSAALLGSTRAARACRTGLDGPARRSGDPPGLQAVDRTSSCRRSESSCTRCDAAIARSSRAACARKGRRCPWRAAQGERQRAAQRWRCAS